MATSQHHDEEEEQGARPRRTHRVPGHLEDYVLAHPPRRLVPPTSEYIQSSYVDYQPGLNYQTSSPERRWTEMREDHETDRLRRMEQCVMDVQQQVRMLQSILQMSLEPGRPHAHQLRPGRAAGPPLLYSDIRRPAINTDEGRVDMPPPTPPTSMQSLPAVFHTLPPNVQPFSFQPPRQQQASLLSPSQAPVQLPPGFVSPGHQVPSPQMPVSAMHSPLVPRPGSAPAGLPYPPLLQQQQYREQQPPAHTTAWPSPPSPVVWQPASPQAHPNPIQDPRHGPAMIPSINSLPLGQPPVLQSQHPNQAAGQQYAFPHSPYASA
ncbi:Filamentous hemagglutinin [Dissostichus eleginoides]|uniref:Filamentous hemagglutinin n=1 Tax=Dissostichus eleginoides TaxID=100907 RepID=A0AAD9B4C7_DISEL|nr:Filamentous hemagglutinin [Dissostichus eleginoides]